MLGLLGADTLWLDVGTDERAFLIACVEACLTYRGDPPRRGGKQGGQDGGEDVALEEGAPWTSATAKTILQNKKQPSFELTQDKLLHYMSGWCDMPKVIEPSCCYEDCAVLYDDILLPAHQVDRDTLANCYLRIPHSIKETVPVDGAKATKKNYSQTFWGNACVFECCQAAQALAKRGLNVVRLFI